MHHLAIDTDHAPRAITEHPDLHDAHRALLAFVVHADYYLHRVRGAPTDTCYQLLRLPDPEDPTASRHPQIAGTATITEAAAAELRFAATHSAARDANRGIEEHGSTWLPGSASDPEAGAP